MLLRPSVSEMLDQTRKLSDLSLGVSVEASLLIMSVSSSGCNVFLHEWIKGFQFRTWNVVSEGSMFRIIAG